ncbi:MAG: hypothetical protein ACLSIR_04845 [Christensenellales bacterium]
MSTACWAASAESWRHRHESCSGHRYKLLHHILRVGHAGGGDFVLFQAAADGGGWRARAYAVAGIVSACQKPAADGSKCDGRCAGRGDLRGLRKHPSALNGGFVCPCFGRRSGTRAARALLRVPFYPVSHQEGHVRAAMVDAGIDGGKPFLALHLSGGTTEILLCENGRLTLLGGSLDLHAGQLVDRTGVRLHMPFPAGPSLEKLAMQGKPQGLIGVSVKGASCNMAGAENKVTKWIESGAMPNEQIAAEVLIS